MKKLIYKVRDSGVFDQSSSNQKKQSSSVSLPLLNSPQTKSRFSRNRSDASLNENTFLDTLRSEIDKVEAFYKQKLYEFELQVKLKKREK